MPWTVCGICTRPKVHARASIYVCVICDTDNENMTLGLIWPDDYVEWTRGTPYPGAAE